MKLTISKSKNSESFYISMSYSNNGKSTTKTFKKLGTLNQLSEQLGTDRDGVVAWCKQQVLIATEEYQKESEKVMVPFSIRQRIDPGITRNFNCGYLFLQCLYHQLNMNNITRNISNRYKFDYDLDAILADLIFTRVIEPTSKLSSYKAAQRFLEPPKYSEQDMYRSLSVLSTEMDYIQAEVYRNSNFVHSRNTRVLYYDCTDFFFEIQQEDGDKKYGKGKEHRPNPIIRMGLFMDSDGVPLAFDMYPGNQNEQITLKPLEQKVIRDFQLSKFVYCSDAGLASRSNKQFNSFQDRAYVITQSLKKLKEEDRKIAMDPRQFRRMGSEKWVDLRTLDEEDDDVVNAIYYKEMPVGNENIIITYSIKYKNYQTKIRQGQIERAMKMISENGKCQKNRKNPNDPARFITKTAITENGEAADEVFYQLDQDTIDKEAQYDGFYAISTNLDDDVQTIIAINQRRWQIEECFRIMKTNFDARPVFVRTQDSIRAHFLVCFLALLVYRLLEIKLENLFSVEQIISTLKNMNLVELMGHGYIPAYTRTELTDKLHNVFGFQTDHEITRKSKMISIIHQTKS